MPTRRVNEGRTEVKYQCPACAEKIEGEPNRAAQQLQVHYFKEHAVTDPEVTTYIALECRRCGHIFPTESDKRRHSCVALRPRTKREGEDEHGWLPLEIPVVEEPEK